MSRAAVAHMLAPMNNRLRFRRHLLAVLLASAGTWAVSPSAGAVVNGTPVDSGGPLWTGTPEAPVQLGVVSGYVTVAVANTAVRRMA